MTQTRVRPPGHEMAPGSPTDRIVARGTRRLLGAGVVVAHPFVAVLTVRSHH